MEIVAGPVFHLVQLRRGCSWTCVMWRARWPTARLVPHGVRHIERPRNRTTPFGLIIYFFPNGGATYRVPSACASPTTWTNSVSTPPTSRGCRKAMEEPIDPCRGSLSISWIPATFISFMASVISATA
jgi:hypothetical protein